MDLYFSVSASVKVELTEEDIEQMIEDGVDFEDEDSVRDWAEEIDIYEKIDFCYFDMEVDLDDFEISKDDKLFIAKTKYKLLQEQGIEDKDLLYEIEKIINTPLNGQLDIFGGVVRNV